jgi:uncharacterized protein
MKLQKTPYYSYKIGNLPKGCQLCVEGSKEVIFITGLCPRSCYFCPISDKKYKKDVTYADEWPTTNINEIIKEAKLINAKGAGLTGGDPLCKLKRTLHYIKALKKQFGKEFHIHLYTSLDLVTEDNLKKLHKAGLDEIRFHLDFDNNRLWAKLALPLAFEWDVGIEIPVIPSKEAKIKKIIQIIDNINKNSESKIKFLNLNELEIADNKISKLAKLGYKTKDQFSYAIKGSNELALKLLKFISNKKIKLNVHYCTATLKDKVQLANRIKRRAKNTAKPFDIINKDGTLTRGVIYIEELKPSFKYNSMLKEIKPAKKSKIIKKLNTIKNELKKDFKIKNELIDIDKNKLRILTSVKEIRKISKNKKLKNKELSLAIVTEYPTHDQLELDIKFL